MIDYNSRRWSRTLLAMRGTVTRRIAFRIVAVAGWAAVVEIIDQFVRPVGVTAIAHTLTGLAVGLLLVFRTNTAYERFWEGRKQWGGIVNDTRNVARTTTAFLDRASTLLPAILSWTAAFPYASMHSLRSTASLGPMAEKLPAAEVARVLAAGHVPSAVALRISQLIAEARAAGHLTDYVAMQIEGTVARLLDCLGACERIRKTPVPFAYVVHLRTALVVFMATLPFALVDAFGWSSILYNAVIAFVLLGIEEIGVEIENPFGTDANDLPLDQICATIEKDLLG